MTPIELVIRKDIPYLLHTPDPSTGQMQLPAVHHVRTKTVGNILLNNHSSLIKFPRFEKGSFTTLIQQYSIQLHDMYEVPIPKHTARTARTDRLEVRVEQMFIGWWATSRTNITMLLNTHPNKTELESNIQTTPKFSGIFIPVVSFRLANPTSKHDIAVTFACPNPKADEDIYSITL